MQAGSRVRAAAELCVAGPQAGRQARWLGTSSRAGCVWSSPGGWSLAERLCGVVTGSAAAGCAGSATALYSQRPGSCWSAPRLRRWPAALQQRRDELQSVLWQFAVLSGCPHNRSGAGGWRAGAAEPIRCSQPSSFQQSPCPACCAPSCSPASRIRSWTYIPVHYQHSSIQPSPQQAHSRPCSGVRTGALVPRPPCHPSLSRKQSEQARAALG